VTDDDNDGIPLDEDCDDNDPNSTAIADDADCDGALTAADCDDNDPNSTVIADDADCDGALAAADCDDTDDTSTLIADDADCDGVLTFDDCNDADATIYPGAPDVVGDGIDQDCDGLDSAAPMNGSLSNVYTFDTPQGDFQDCLVVTTLSPSTTPPTTGCADCDYTWRVDFQQLMNTCGAWSTPLTGNSVNLGLDIVAEQLWLNHDNGGGWVTYGGGTPVQSTLSGTSYSHEELFDNQCFDLDADTYCDPGTNYEFTETFNLNW